MGRLLGGRRLSRVVSEGFEDTVVDGEMVKIRRESIGEEEGGQQWCRVRTEHHWERDGEVDEVCEVAFAGEK